MTIREAKRGDLRPMAEATAAAFMDEELFGELIHPHRKEYPQDFVAYFERRFLRHWHDPSNRFLVGVDDATGKVVAVAQWQRMGAKPSWSQALTIGSLMQSASKPYLQAVNYLWPNRAADPKRLNILEETFPLFAHHWNESRQQNWFLDVLATHPDFQGQGHGRELVMWGVNQAKEEKVCASVVSSYGKDVFYGKCGFVEVGRANVGALKECGIKGGAVMFCEGHLSR